ncbi:hypothetical protein VII00023_02074 [Vibrio ichthyoenteri ATCC 700023]|uniref:Uncharacterized protein n=1 Tax=Vibrio ichthyoenteri ATCC 700023 TaxID=870968 RepID=F9RY24_9VIBR|nr:hypothetical protein [Vibrio ichthyoenteri]EGU47024.1 hypothetical protein VII00023_02074 [Vibrio ichthyoenteri ATCC 700023]
MEAIWAAVDFADTAIKVGAAGVAIIGITMAYKAIGLGKRAVKSA